MSFLNQIFLIAPLFLPALSLSLGILTYWAFSFYLLCFLMSIGGLFLLLAKIKIHDRSAALFTLLPCILGIIAAYKQHHDFFLLHHALTGKSISVRGSVIDIDKRNDEKFPYVITFLVDSYKTEEQIWQKITGRIKIMTNRYKPCIVGDFIEINNIQSQSATGDFLNYLMKENISAYFFTGYVYHLLLSRPLISLSRFLYKKRKKLEKILQSCANDNTIFYFNMLFLGKKEKSDEGTSTTDYFKNWGISHMTARSGMHMTIVSLLCYSLMNFFPFSFLYKQIILGIIIVLYGLFSYPTVSFARSFLTTIFMILYHCVYVRSNFLYITFLVYIFQLLYNPLCLFFLDFQLSFLLTLGIGFFSKKYFYKTLI